MSGSMILRLVAIALLGVTSSLEAQEAFTNSLPKPTAPQSSGSRPDTAWIDLRQQVAAGSTPQSAPAWVEAVGLVPPDPKDSAGKSVFRIRVTPPGPEYQILFFRLFFDDKPDARPELVAWDESGSQVLRSGHLGAGIGLPSSDSVMIPMIGGSTIDIEVPGDGKTVRGAYLDWMTSSEVIHPVSAAHRDVIPEPFSDMPPLHAPEQDAERFGTVTATLSPDAIPMGPDMQSAAVFQFGVESQPLVALLTFEVASPRIDSPPEVYLNGTDLGPVSLALPELADPGYRGEMEPLLKDMHFQYTGWLRAQKIVPAANLKAGNNDLIIVNGSAGSNSVIRATQIELKYLWEKSDYLLRTGQ
jgi:hypothetical protein